MGKIRLLVATQDRDLLVSLLIFLREAADIFVVGTAGNRRSLLALAQSDQPDIVLADETLFYCDAADLAEQIHRIEPQPHLIVLTMQEANVPTLAVADAVVLKHSSPDQLLDCLRGFID